MGKYHRVKAGDGVWVMFKVILSFFVGVVMHGTVNDEAQTTW